MKKKGYSSTIRRWQEIGTRKLYWLQLILASVFFSSSESALAQAVLGASWTIT